MIKIRKCKSSSKQNRANDTGKEKKQVGRKKSFESFDEDISPRTLYEGTSQIISENSCYVCKNVLLALRSPLDILLKFTKTPLYQYLGEHKIFQHINNLL